MYEENNIFAKIIRGEIPCEKIYEDDNVFFFNDINPVAKIHVLGVPKTPCKNFSHFLSTHNDLDVSQFFKKTAMVIKRLGIEDGGYKIITNSGINGGQEVPHFHIHILGGEKISMKII